MDIQILSEYSRCFENLRTDRTGGWTEKTKNQAPHKPILLLSVLDRFAEAGIPTNLIEITPGLGDLFASYWSTVMPGGRHGNMALPFFHLRSSGFWHLIPRPGMEEVASSIRQIDTINQFNKLYVGAKLDDELFALFQIEEARNALRLVLINTYFSPELCNSLMNLGEVNLESYIYSEALIEKARKVVKETPTEEEQYQVSARNQGFRKAVIKVYNHRCAFCGVRMMTTDGHTAIDAAHIIPWKDTHNDDLTNGMALCRLCHWTFDEGLVGVSKKYLVMLSRELRSDINMPGHLLTLENRLILGPDEKDFWPDPNALDWHAHKVFR